MKLNEIYGAGSDDEIPGVKNYGKYYDNLNDAQRIDRAYSPGNNYEIWYTKSNQFRDFSMGLDWVKEKTPEKMPLRVSQLPRTHAKVGSISGEGFENMESLFVAMQGEMWSPEGEARELIQRLGVGHTSMSVGDVVVTADGKIWFTDSYGFEEIHPIESYRG